jgi:hypothetical protein
MKGFKEMALSNITKKALNDSDLIVVNVSGWEVMVEFIGWEVMVEFIGRRGYRVTIDLPIEPDESDKTVTLVYSEVFGGLPALKSYVRCAIKEAPLKASQALKIANLYDFGYLSLDQLVTLHENSKTL